MNYLEILSIYLALLVISCLVICEFLEGKK